MRREQAACEGDVGDVAAGGMDARIVAPGRAREREALRP
ncbi:hypothetical protein NX02_11040 [Sphingomonas sanxanigenens DSM 19645 = NX02]|uniref:Uncharacterized protein n=1 Tax=Sphingomonas sanxanigenens DSM 19645 = NX02 TaxID=1123269 RepID=W0AE08_9SPHN|nr:hypothetical protein NX02_11040 [Sphingomonas sanxanigenens DSM 19645 = NX02]